MLLAGMVGSTIGWREVGYIATPPGLDEVAAGLLVVDHRTAIVPGVARDDPDRADVMRGEEVQLLGACAAGLVPADALVVQPGTHCKWAEMHDGRIVRFVTAMTGELFALLRDHSILASFPPARPAPTAGTRPEPDLRAVRRARSRHRHRPPRRRAVSD